LGGGWWLRRLGGYAGECPGSELPTRETWEIGLVIHPTIAEHVDAELS